MKRKKWFVVMSIGLMVLGGCGGGAGESGNEEAVIRQETAEDAGGQEKQSGKADSAAELLRFRQDREDMIKLEGEYTEMGTPNEAEYDLDFSPVYDSPEFEYQEMADAYETAERYVTDTLGIRPSTKCEVYMCMDPEMYKIYGDTDKGVAAGYESGNIFLAEFCDESNSWQCLVMVREGKGQPWKVIYHGNDYKERTV